MLVAEKIVKRLSGQGDRKAATKQQQKKIVPQQQLTCSSSRRKEEEVEKENSGSRSRQGPAEEDKRSRQRRALGSNYSNRGDRLLKRLSGGSKVVSAGAR